MIFLNNLGLMSTRELVAMVGSYQLQPPVKKPQDLRHVHFLDKKLRRFSRYAATGGAAGLAATPPAPEKQTQNEKSLTL